jgi:predicted O-methyltransferase YrrM
MKSIRILANKSKLALKKNLRRTAQMVGYDIVKYHSPRDTQLEFPPDFGPHHISIVRAVQGHTLTSLERLFGLIESVEYVTRMKIPGSIVECGVWRGGSMMAVALALRHYKAAARDLYLFDTFEGMTRPTDADVHYSGAPALAAFTKLQTGEDSSDECAATLAEVQQGMAQTGYDANRIHYVKGKVENTIPKQAPDQIALLRLDTDWYESTKHELEHLFPRLSKGGVLIIDDYGDWQGARKATDEYMASHAPYLFLNRIDYTGRIALKTS